MLAREIPKAVFDKFARLEEFISYDVASASDRVHNLLFCNRLQIVMEHVMIHNEVVEFSVLRVWEYVGSKFTLKRFGRSLKRKSCLIKIVGGPRTKRGKPLLTEDVTIVLHRKFYQREHSLKNPFFTLFGAIRDIAEVLMGENKLPKTSYHPVSSYGHGIL